MRIGLAGYLMWHRTARYGGHGTYISQLITAMASVPSEHDVRVFLGPDGDQRFRPPGLRLHRTRLPIGSRLARVAYEQGVLPRTAARLGIDVFHFLDPVGTLMSPAPTVVTTIHDLTVIRHPETHGSLRARHRRYRITSALKKARLVIADSNATRADLVSLLGFPDDRIRVVHLGVDHGYSPRSEQEIVAVRAKYGLPAEFLLYVGRIEPRKNLSRLLEAHAHLRHRWGLDPVLAVVGKPSWLYEEILELPRRLGIEDRVRFLDYVDGSDLPALYSGAAAFAYPSLYEGFGLPVLEAMACGAPVVSSNASSIPEVAGDAAVLVDPYDVSAIAEALHRVLTDNALRSSLRVGGLEQARGFSWEKTAIATLAVYEEAVSEQS